jgi:carbamoyltransferase
VNILGVHVGHDLNICQLSENSIKHIEFERITRRKHEFEIKDKFTDYFFSIFTDDRNDIISIVLSETEKSIRKIKEILNINYEDIKKSLNLNLTDNIFIERFNKKIYLIDHHVAHASYSYYTRPFDDCDTISYDGFGYYTDLLFTNNLKTLDNKILGLGFLWKIICDLYYKSFHCEGKFMGLSAYGKESDKVFILFNSIINKIKKIEEIHDIHERKSRKNTLIEECIKDSINIFNSERIENISRTLQVYSEELVASYLMGNKKSDNLCISGGIGLNGYINKMIIDRKIYKEIHVPPAVGDCGLSVGACLFAINKYKDFIIRENIAYLGNSFDLTKNNIEKLIENKKELKYREFEYEEVYNYITRKIIDGKIIGWYQGRSESGPRALGNRSIICDPRVYKMKDYLNEKVKHREWYRPFAPAILKDHVSNWFENIEEDPYMLRICKFKDTKIGYVPAVCHVDNTGRVQTVTKESNLHFYNLIKSFFDETNIPILLNTSFNDRGEPIVDSPLDAFKCFLNTGIDILVLHNFVIEKDYT